MRYVTPLRYPGGKSRLANFAKLVFEANDLRGGHYAEPFAGGASIAFHLLFSGYATCIHVNDLSRSVYSFWWSVSNDTENLCRLISSTRVSMTAWHRQKEIQANPDQYSILELGFSTFFLNRTNRSGIITGGVIGGQDQDGDWTLDARYNKPALIARVKNIAQYKDKIKLYNEDAAEFTANIVARLPQKSLTYLDPPYYSKGQRLYENHYLHDDHADIAERVARLRRKWIVSYDDAPQVRALYDNFRKLPFKLSYSANDRYSGSEIMFFCNNLVIPEVEDPLRIPKPQLSKLLQPTVS